MMWFVQYQDVVFMFCLYMRIWENTFCNRCNVFRQVLRSVIVEFELCAAFVFNNHKNKIRCFKYLYTSKSWRNVKISFTHWFCYTSNASFKIIAAILVEFELYTVYNNWCSIFQNAACGLSSLWAICGMKAVWVNLYYVILFSRCCVAN